MNIFDWSNDFVKTHNQWNENDSNFTYYGRKVGVLSFSVGTLGLYGTASFAFGVIVPVALFIFESLLTIGLAAAIPPLLGIVGLIATGVVISGIFIASGILVAKIFNTATPQEDQVPPHPQFSANTNNARTSAESDEFARRVEQPKEISKAELIKILEISSDANHKTARKAWRKFNIDNHPDKFNDLVGDEKTKKHTYYILVKNAFERYQKDFKAIPAG